MAGALKKKLPKANLIDVAGTQLKGAISEAATAGSVLQSDDDADDEDDDDEDDDDDDEDDEDDDD